MFTLFVETALLPKGWAENVRLAIDGRGRIASVETGVEAAPGDHIATDRILLPAPVNLHSHTFQRAFAGLTEGRGPDGRDSFWSWRRLSYAFLDRMTPDHLEAIAALAQIEMLEAGFGAVAEFHYVHRRPGGGAYDDPAETSTRIVAAAARTGIGLTHLPVYYAQGGLDGRPLEGPQLRFATDRDGFAAIHDGAATALAGLGEDGTLGIAPHSLRAVSAEDLRHLVATYGDAPIHIHIAEQTAEVDDVVAATGRRPVAWLLDEMPVDAQWCLIHATHMTAEETTAVAASGAVAGLCPVTEANLGDGIFPAAAFMDQGGRIGIGTDSNVAVDLVQELRSLEYSQRLRDRARAVLAGEGKSTGRRLFDAACRGGAQAAGRRSGAMLPGAWADLLLLDRSALWFDGLRGDAILDAWLFAAKGQLVTDVWSAGRHVVRGGRHIDRDAIQAEFRKTAATLRTEP